MRRKIGYFTGLIVVAAAALGVAGNDRPASAPVEDPATRKAAEIERGKYLAQRASLCIVCHSPKDENGRPIYSRAFQGGVIPAQATYPKMATFATHAPALSPLVGGAPDDVVYLLQTGIWRPSGQSPRPPMPPFRLSEDDAKAVVAYLRSVQPSPPQ